ncbi:MAG: MBL fold metallo-hydrolase [Rhodothermales bacterium]|nr:MBL fold metallo-hydrolase [Rhodothermales bacterium]MBO6779530.1 MBL fold metallo-hydrolase [Rhodothermales bacterium]
MADPVRVTLLGTGTSTGVPVIGCRCRVCNSPDPRDRRSRCSALVEWGGVSVLIDVGPDFRMQALTQHVEHIDAVLFTHHHFDHVVGLDDLRPFLFRNREAIPCYAPRETEQTLRRMFAYIFEDGSYPGVSNLTLTRIDSQPVALYSRRDDAAIEVQPIPVSHGGTTVFGYRFGPFAYLTDTNLIPKESFRLLDGVEVLVLDALRRDPHRSHFSFDEAVAAAERIGARETWFVHMTHSVLHAVEDAALPPGMRLAYDGLRLEA